MMIILIITMISILLLIVSIYLSNKIKHNYNINLVISPYECGFNPYNPLNSFAIAKFYLIAVLYLLFDLELSILLPLGYIFQFILHHYIYTIYILIIILFIGFIAEKYYDIISLSHFRS